MRMDGLQGQSGHGGEEESLSLPEIKPQWSSLLPVTLMIDQFYQIMFSILKWLDLF